MQELEGKLRKCELLGVEASMEIQASARLVAEENKRLRALLRSRGFMAHEIDTTIGESATDIEPFARASILEAQLGAKKRCTISTSSARHFPQSILLRQTSKASDVPPRNTHEEYRPLVNLTFAVPKSNRASMSPNSETRMATDLWAMQEYERSNVNAQLQDITEKPALDLGAEISSGSNTSSCIFAANIITSMRADVSAEDVKAELGCDNQVADCTVDNTRFFTAMDRYTG